MFTKKQLFRVSAMAISDQFVNLGFLNGAIAVIDIENGKTKYGNKVIEKLNI
jgi:hypothetical protein